MQYITQNLAHCKKQELDVYYCRIPLQRYKQIHGNINISIHVYINELQVWSPECELELRNSLSIPAHTK